MANDTAPTDCLTGPNADLDDIASGLNRLTARSNLRRLRMMSADVPTGDKAVAKSAAPNNGAGQHRKLTVSSLGSLAPSF